MPDWQAVVVPPLCPRCGAYWECEHVPHRIVGADAAAVPQVISSRLSDDGWGREDVVEFAGLPFDPNVQPVLRYIAEDEDDA